MSKITVLLAAIGAGLLASSPVGAESLACQTVNGQTMCMRGNGSMSCQTINGQTTCTQSSGSGSMSCETINGRAICSTGQGASLAPPSVMPDVWGALARQGLTIERKGTAMRIQTDDLDLELE
ncbi:MAG TPA: hypothetical protein VD978_28665 [Azospirillum sp.]|nr:hypothetical protein [Azospirillum sp.]